MKISRRHAVIAFVLLTSLGVGATSSAQLSKPRLSLEEFFGAVARDDVRVVRDELLRGVSVNVKSADGMPALLVATTRGAFAVARALLDSPAIDAEATTPTGETALMHAVLNGHLDLARQLVKRGARVNRPGWTPLHYAASGGHVEVIRWLAQQKAELNALSANGTTPLMIAARERREAAADLLVELGADPTLHNAAGFDAAGYFDRWNLHDAAVRMRAASDAFDLRSATRSQTR